MCKLKTILDLILSKAISSGPINGFKVCGFFGSVKAVNLNQLFAIPQFDAETELQFWQARNPVLLTPMKSALLLGALGFLAFILLDVYSGKVSLLEAWLRLPIVIVLCALFGYLHFGSKSVKQLNTIAKISAVLSSADLLAVFLIDGQPQYYAETLKSSPRTGSSQSSIVLTTSCLRLCLRHRPGPAGPPPRRRRRRRQR